MAEHIRNLELVNINNVGMTLQLADTRWLTPAKTGYGLGVKKRVRLAMGVTLRWV